MIRATRPWLVLLSAILVAACSDDSETVSPHTTAPPGSTVQARFELPAQGLPQFLDVPFPADLYLDDSKKIADLPGLEAFVPANGEFLVAGLSQNRGFGTTAGALFRIDDTAANAPADIDDASLPKTEDDSIGAGATVMLVDLDASDAASALVPARAEYHDDRDLGSKAPPTLAVFPARGVALAEAHRYAAVVTTGLKPKNGAAVGPSATFAAIRDGSRRSSDAEKRYGEVVDALAKLVPALADPTKIAAVTFYTTHDIEHELLDLRSASAEQPPPPLEWDATDLAPMGPGLFAPDPLPAGYTATLDAWLGAPEKLPDGTDDPANDSLTGRGHDAIAAMGTAVFEAPNYLLESDAGSSDLAYHIFARDQGGEPVVNPDKPTSKIWVTLILPKGAVPASGFPVVLMQHGLSSDRKFLLAAANTFAKRGFATAGIESVTFGARAPSASSTVDEHATWPWSQDVGRYDGPDGFVDEANGPIDFFGMLKNLGALRDHLRQSVLDIGVLGAVVRDPALDLGPLLVAVPGAKLDPDRVAYLGDSLGGIMGAMVAAVDPHIGTFVLNVAGAALVVELANGPYIASQIQLAAGLNFGLVKQRFSPGHPIVQLMQHVIDPGDPLIYAHHVVTAPATIAGAKNAPKNVLQIEVLWDELVCNESDEALARAAGFALAEPSTGPRAGVPLASAEPKAGAISGVPLTGITAVVVQASPAAHGSDLHSRKGSHDYAHPWALFDQAVPFPELDQPFEFDQPYLALQDMVTGFIETAFTGQAPVVKGFPTPVLDFDGDGTLDVDDAAPNDPAKQ